MVETQLYIRKPRDTSVAFGHNYQGAAGLRLPTAGTNPCGGTGVCGPGVGVFQNDA